MDVAPIATIGHSDRTWEELVETLQESRIGTVIDIRTTPFSNHYPHFNQNVLEVSLPLAGIKYIHLGAELGARRTEAHLLSSEGKVSYVKVREDPDFKRAIRQIEAEARAGNRLVLLCTEASPMECHRFPMVAYQLALDGFQVHHIYKDGSIKTHNQVEQELVDWYERKFAQPGLFEASVSKADQLEAAYLKLNLKIGYTPHEHENRNLRA